MTESRKDCRTSQFHHKGVLIASYSVEKLMSKARRFVWNYRLLSAVKKLTFDSKVLEDKAWSNSGMNDWVLCVLRSVV